MIINRNSLILLVILNAVHHSLPAQFDEYAVKAAFIERFTRFIDWPSSMGENPKSEFTIGHMGDSHLIPKLRDLLENRTIKGRKVSIIRIDNADEIASHNLQVLFLSEYAGDVSEGLNKILSKASTLSILTIGDSPGFGKLGVMLNLILENENIRFEINEEALRNTQFDVSYHLYQYGRTINLTKKE